MKKELRLLLMVAIFAVFSLVVFPGYQVFISDHNLYVPSIEQSLNPALFQNDFLLSFSQASYSLFNELIISLMNIFHINILYVFFFLSLFVRFIYFYSVYKIAFYFTNNQKFSIFSILLFIAGSNIFGTASSTLDIFLTPRAVAIALNLLFLACFLSRKWLLSTLLLGIGLLLHPISSLPFIIFFYIELFFLFHDIRSTDKKDFLGRSLIFLATLGIIPILFLIFLLLRVEPSGLNPLTLIDSAWEGIIRARARYIFITDWYPTAFLYLITNACFFAVSRLELKEIFENATKKKHLYLLILIPLFLFALSFISVDILKMHFFAQLQIHRGLLLWKIFITLLFSYFAYKHIVANRQDILYNFSLFGIVVALALKEFFVFIFFPIFLFLWIKRKYNLFGLAKIKIFNNKYFPLAIFGAEAVGLSLACLLKNNLNMLFYLIAIIFFSWIAALMVSWKVKFVFRNGLIFAFFVLLVIVTILFVPKFSIEPQYFKNRPLIEACDWIKNNTNEQDVFITEPFSRNSGPLRLVGQRNVFVCNKDGAQAVFKRDYALEWKKRMDLVDGLNENPGLVSGISNQYRVNYIFSDSGLDIAYPLVFSNLKYFIYSVPTEKP